MYAYVLFVYRNKDFIKLLLENGTIAQFPKQLARFVKKGDRCILTESKGKPKLTLLTDDDEVVKVNKPDRKRLVPYGYFGPFTNPPDPIITP